MKHVKLPSGRTLTITLASFPVSRSLYQAFLGEVKGLKLDAGASLDVNFFKDIVCTALESKNIENAVWECMKRCLIDDKKIDVNSFEEADNRDDYFMVMMEVCKENIQPFTKSLYAQYGHLLEMVSTSIQASV